MLTGKSFAKINLYLEITGKTPKGYHLLESLMAYLEIFDQITFNKSDKLQLKISGENADILNQNDQENIILKAVNLLAQKYNFDPQIEISLIKNIPISAGLGGGSANAATILLLLNDFYKLNLNSTELQKIGLILGSDVPFCLYKKIALVEGIGEKISPVKIPDQNLFALIVNPKKSLSTKNVFELFSEKYLDKISQNSSEKIIRNSLKNSSLIEVIKNRQNHLEKAAMEIIPEVAEILKTLADQKNCQISRMSGSGATCFGLFENSQDLDLAEENLQKIFPEFYIKKSRIIYQL